MKKSKTGFVRDWLIENGNISTAFMKSIYIKNYRTIMMRLRNEGMMIEYSDKKYFLHSSRESDLVTAQRNQEYKMKKLFWIGAVVFLIGLVGFIISLF